MQMIQARKSADVIAALALCAGCLNYAWAAEEDRIVTYRPDVVESSDVVGKGCFQIETSIDYERDKQTGLKTRTLRTPALFRLGISESLELRAETDGRVRERSEAPRRQ